MRGRVTVEYDEAYSPGHSFSLEYEFKTPTPTRRIDMVEMLHEALRQQPVRPHIAMPSLHNRHTTFGNAVLVITYPTMDFRCLVIAIDEVTLVSGRDFGWTTVSVRPV